MSVLVIDAALIIAASICVGGALGLVLVGGFLLRDVRKDSVRLLAELPTLAVGETPAERKANRETAWRELCLIILIRSAPGCMIAVAGIVLVALLSFRTIDLASILLW